MKRTLKMLLVIVTALGMSGYARAPERESVSYQQARAASAPAVARLEAPKPAGATDSPAPSEFALFLCGFVVVGVIARRKSRLVAG